MLEAILRRLLCPDFDFWTKKVTNAGGKTPDSCPRNEEFMTMSSAFILPFSWFAFVVLHPSLDWNSASLPGLRTVVRDAVDSVEPSPSVPEPRPRSSFRKLAGGNQHLLWANAGSSSVTHPRSGLLHANNTSVPTSTAPGIFRPSGIFRPAKEGGATDPPQPCRFRTTPSEHLPLVVSLLPLALASSFILALDHLWTNSHAPSGFTFLFPS